MSHQQSRRSILVFADWQEMATPLLMGNLHSEIVRGKEIFSFEYSPEWLESKFAHVLDPDLSLYSGIHYLNSPEKTNFGIFLDSSPDRWGRVLMERREAAIARVENRDARHLFETDFLLGVYDGHRMGGLRFKLSAEGNFLNDNMELASPPWTSLKTLEEISLKLEDNDVENNPSYLKWLNMLVEPGSSLGGARPKASIIDNSGDLWLAKFPSKNDNTNIGGWEKVTHDLAASSGLNVVESQAICFSNKHHTFLTKRFDRINEDKRIHFASALSLLGYRDGQSYHEGASYLKLAEFIITNAATPIYDLEELWRRIVFSICVSNTDDHLRNHGFTLQNNGWKLSPAYDINPVEYGTGLSLNISEKNNALSLDLAIEVKNHFRITDKRADEIIKKVTSAVAEWRKVASKYGIPKSEQDRKARAFSHF